MLEAFKSSDEIVEFINNNIFHVYGRIGCLDKLTPKKLGSIVEQIIPFGLPNNQINKISGLTDHIKLIYEERDINSEIKKTITESDEVLIMGYGFDYINNIKIVLDELKQNSKTKIAVHSSLDKDKEQRIKAFINNAFIEVDTCLEFLKGCWY